MSLKVIIVGGVAGGASAAARLRRLDEQAEIIMVERDEYISYANCGLPYYIGGTIQERSKLLIQTPEMMRNRFNIDVRVNSEVIQVVPESKTVLIRHQGITYEETFDVLILSPGAKPVRPEIEGVHHPRILSLRNIPDTDKLKSVVDLEQVRDVTIVGGGFIGVEMAEVLTERGIQVTLVEASQHILAPFDSDISVIMEKELQDHGVQLRLGESVSAFQELDEEHLEVVLQSGGSHQAGLVILAIGVRPETGFLNGSGIILGPKGHIIVNEHLQTNYDYIYAVGDAIEVVDFVSGTKTAVPLAGPANKQGRVAADHICGLNSRYQGTQGTSILKVFGLTAACTGSNERVIKQRDVRYQAIVVHPNSHAAYYPGATSVTLKLLFSDTGAILGAQAAGQNGVDKRIDVIATVMRLNGTISDLTELELTYAPPYSSAKDPVNMAGFVAENARNGKCPVATLEDIESLIPEFVTLLDVRSSREYESGHIPGAINIPVDELRQRLEELDTSKKLLVYCQVGYRGYTASRILLQHGYNAANLTGGYKSYAISRT